MLDNIESEYPGYDEYRVTADEIEHDPYVLISILSAWHEGVFTLDEAQSTLEMRTGTDQCSAADTERQDSGRHRFVG